MSKHEIVNWPEFYTATIKDWKPLLYSTKYKEIIIASLTFMVKNNRIVLNAFVIMDTHIHLIWQSKSPYTPQQARAAFLKYTGRKIINLVEEEQTEFVADLSVQKYDRKHQVWKRDSLAIELFSRAAFLQKLVYIHDNPVKAGLCKTAETYYYSSAAFYQDGSDVFKILSHYEG
ncbi:MAG: transposase [Ferruginibacter sp.]|nr:transposase [Ferruginibacter sp.]